MSNENENRKAILCNLNLAFPRQKLDNDSLALYMMSLEDVPTIALKYAVLHAIQNMKFIPSVSELREIAQKATCKKRIKQWDEAWAEVNKQIAQCGPYTTPTWSCPEIQQAVRTLGWANMCNSSSSMLQTLTAQFRNIYTNLVERKREDHEHSLTVALLAHTANEEERAKIETFFLGEGQKQINGKRTRSKTCKCKYPNVCYLFGSSNAFNCTWI